MPSRLQLPAAVASAITFVVPTFHLEAHIDKCKATFSSRLLKHMGRTDFEGIERGWANLNGAASSTKEMRPGHRRDVLDDFCGAYNWDKTIKLGTYRLHSDYMRACILTSITGTTMLRKMVVAIPSAVLHRATLNAFEENLHARLPAYLEEWQGMYEAWQNSADKSIDNPFVAERIGSYYVQAL